VWKLKKGRMLICFHKKGGAELVKNTICTFLKLFHAFDDISAVSDSVL
jgi:hypothetical protein